MPPSRQPPVPHAHHRLPTAACSGSRIASLPLESATASVEHVCQHGPDAAHVDGRLSTGHRRRHFASEVAAGGSWTTTSCLGAVPAGSAKSRNRTACASLGTGNLLKQGGRRGTQNGAVRAGLLRPQPSPSQASPVPGLCRARVPKTSSRSLQPRQRRTRSPAPGPAAASPGTAEAGGGADPRPSLPFPAAVLPSGGRRRERGPPGPGRRVHGGSGDAPGSQRRRQRRTLRRGASSFCGLVRPLPSAPSGGGGARSVLVDRERALPAEPSAAVLSPRLTKKGRPGSSKTDRLAPQGLEIRC